MPETRHLMVTDTVSIPRAELSYRATRAGGPGGQHVNTASTRIELLWDLSNSRAVTDDERARIRNRLARRLDADGRVRVVSSEHRSQQQNRQAAEERLVAVVRRALHVPRVRRPTKPSRAAAERRLSEKRHRADRKRDRRGDLDG